MIDIHWEIIGQKSIEIELIHVVYYSEHSSAPMLNMRTKDTNGGSKFALLERIGIFPSSLQCRSCLCNIFYVRSYKLVCLSWLHRLQLRLLRPSLYATLSSKPTGKRRKVEAAASSDDSSSNPPIMLNIQLSSTGTPISSTIKTKSQPGSAPANSERKLGFVCVKNWQM